VRGPLGRDTVEAIVDTGATFTKISSTMAEKVGFRGRRQVEVVLANGERASRQLGNLEVGIDSQNDIVPVTVGEDGEANLIGYTTLEILGFKVDPVTRKLEPSPPIEYRPFPPTADYTSQVQQKPQITLRKTASPRASFVNEFQTQDLGLSRYGNPAGAGFPCGGAFGFRMRDLALIKSSLIVAVVARCQYIH